MRFRGGIFEASGGGTLARTLGSSGVVINWSDSNGLGSGGFSAQSGPLTVDLNEAGPSYLVWGQTNFVQNDYALMFGSDTADSDVVFVDNIQLNTGNQTAYDVREIYVDGSQSSTWKAKISGQISSVAFGGTTNGQFTDLLKTGGGWLELSGGNNYAGGTIIAEGTLLVSNMQALGDEVESGAYVQVGSRNSNGVSAALLLNDGIILNRRITANDQSRLGGAYSGTVQFLNYIDLLASVNVTAASNGVARFLGDVRGDGSLTKIGAGTVRIEAPSYYSGTTTISAGTLEFAATASGSSSTAVNGGTLRVLNGGSYATIGSFTVASAGTVIVDFGRRDQFRRANFRLRRRQRNARRRSHRNRHGNAVGHGRRRADHAAKRREIVAGQ